MTTLPEPADILELSADEILSGRRNEIPGEVFIVSEGCQTV